ncbi:MAG: zinc-ribbon domain containing protein [Patescibacteria group bacterium]|jgi:hypothetical protein
MTKQCQQCSKTFQITDSDQAFYQKIVVPAPTLCPDCRQQRRLTWCNEMILYPGECQLCHKKILTIYKPNSPYVSYCRACWWSDKWDPLDYGSEIDLTKPFFPQLQALDQCIPHQATDVGGNNENSDYTNYAGDNKNCYLIFHADLNENCLYTYGLKQSKDTMDGYNNFNCELCYNCIDCHDSYNLKWSQDCLNCSDSFMLKDCVGCHDCFGSVGLRNQKYYWLNKQLTEVEYNHRLEAINFGSHSQVQYWLEKIHQYQVTRFYKYQQSNKTEDCTGNNIYQSKNVLASYDCREVENSKFCSQLSMHVKDSYDYYQYGLNAELIYDCTIVGGNCYNIKFCHQVFDGSSNMEYCISSSGCKNCFGSVSLRQKEFCILNRSYAASEYYELRTKLITAMQDRGEYGQYFPAVISPFGYNETSAQWWFPLTQSMAQAQGYHWQEQLPSTVGQETMTILPDDIKEVNDDILTAILACQNCRKNYKITTHELEYYRARIIPLPNICFYCRHLQRRFLRNPRQLWQRQCMCTQIDHKHAGRCAVNFETTYSPDRKEILYCEDCYQKEAV